MISLRSIENFNTQSNPAGQQIVEFLGWTLDLGSHHLFANDGSAVELTTTKFYLLRAFAKASNRVLFREFDDIARRLGVEKIKTIGDDYQAVAGVPEPGSDHTQVMADMALAMLEALERVNGELNQPFEIRIGLYAGPIVAGIIGRHRFTYDIWGDTVNMASRFESYSLPNRIHIPESIAGILDEKYVLEPRGLLEIRGKGPMNTYFLNGKK